MMNTLLRLSVWKRFFSSDSAEGSGGLLAFLKRAADGMLVFLRFFAILFVCVILGAIALEVKDGSNRVVVKAFTLPKKMQDLSPDGGRIIANQLNRAMRDEEDNLYCQLYAQEFEGKPCIPDSISRKRITGDADNYLLGGNIKLPETGISISDVVEFISRVSGRRSIVGSVYEDNNRLYLQIELDGKVYYKGSRSLDCAGTQGGSGEMLDTANAGDDKCVKLAAGESKRENELNYDLINDMLEESSIQMLSAASPQHNLYYFCTDKTAFDTNRSEAGLTEWFDICSALKDRNLTAASLKGVLENLKEKMKSASKDDSDPEKNMAAKVQLVILDKANAKVSELCVDPNCGSQKVATSEAPVVAAVKLPQVAALSASPPVPVNTVNPAGESGVVANTTVVVAEKSTPVANQNLANLTALWDSCAGNLVTTQMPVVSSKDLLESNNYEGQGTQALNNGLYQQASEAYSKSLSLNCRNAFAWANFGVLFTRQFEADSAEYALDKADKLKPGTDWIKNSLCIARAYQKPLHAMDEALSDVSCTGARDINPLNRVVLDKQFYLAVANRFAAENRYNEAVAAYQKVVSVDNKLDCNTKEVLEGLVELGKKQDKTAETAILICNIKQAAVPLGDNKLSLCNDELQGYCNPPTQ